MESREKVGNWVIYVLLGVMLIALLLSPLLSLFNTSNKETASLQASTVEGILLNKEHGDFSVYASGISWLEEGQNLADILNMSAWVLLDTMPDKSADMEIRLGDDYWLSICGEYACISDSYAYPNETRAYYSIPDDVMKNIDTYLAQKEVVW